MAKAATISSLPKKVKATSSSVASGSSCKLMLGLCSSDVPSRGGGSSGQSLYKCFMMKRLVSKSCQYDLDRRNKDQALLSICGQQAIYTQHAETYVWELMAAMYWCSNVASCQNKVTKNDISQNCSQPLRQIAQKAQVSMFCIVTCNM